MKTFEQYTKHFQKIGTNEFYLSDGDFDGYNLQQLVDELVKKGCTNLAEVQISYTEGYYDEPSIMSMTWYKLETDEEFESRKRKAYDKYVSMSSKRAATLRQKEIEKTSSICVASTLINSNGV